MTPQEYRDLDATALAALVRAGEVSPAELIECAIDAIEEDDGVINAVIHRRFEAARQDAAGLSSGRGSGGEAARPAPFGGVPFLVKDGVCHTAGDPFHNGMRVLRDLDWREAGDSNLAARYRRAGFVIAGRTNLPELALMATTEPLAYGPTRNPWNREHSPGGSSGGSAAAVALGYVPAAHGNDMGGSIRIPASACGLVGLKPTRARHSLGPAFGEFWGPTTHEHVLTRSVRDTAGILDATHGMEVGDPYTAPAPSRPFAAEVGADPGRLRIGMRLTAGLDAYPVDPECATAAVDAARLCEALGHTVVDDPFDALDHPGPAAAGLMFTVFAARDVERWSRRIGREIGLDELEATNAYMCEIGRAVSGTQYLDALEQAQSWSRRAAAWWAEGNDVLITPTLGALAPRLGELGPMEDPAVAFGRAGALTSFVAPFNLTGQPAISLPLGTSASGLPIGVQFVAAYGREDVLLRLASQIEAAAPWAGRRPSR